MTYVVEQINLHHALQVTLGTQEAGSAHMRSWVPVTVAELYIFLALTMLMAHVKKHRLRDYWLTGDILTTSGFGRYMPRDRYFAILRFLHLVTNTDVHLHDPLWKVRVFMEKMRQRFRSFMKPFQKVVIDESLVLYRGNIHFRQYIPSKRHRFGIKLFVLCDCRTGYVLDFRIYSGKSGDIQPDKDIGFGGAVVKELLIPYLGKNHILFTDNYYTSPHLAMFLHHQDTQLVGTVRERRKDMPKFPKKSQKGDIFLQQHGPMLAIHWHDQRKVNVLTTVHQGHFVDSGRVEHRTREIRYKPDAVMDYVINMRLVDKSDMQVGFIDCLRKSCRWYKKFFLHMIDVSALNAYNLYKLLHQDAATRTYKNLRQFQKQVCMDLLLKYHMAEVRAQIMGGADLSARTVCAEYIAQHHVLPLPVGPQGRRPQKRCYVCAQSTRKPRRYTKTSYECAECKVALCVYPCFVEFHTLQQY